MNRFFGSKKPTAPAPTLDDAIQKRSEGVESKIKKLDAELMEYKEKMAKLPEGPAKNQVKQQAMRVLKQKKLYENQRNQMVTQSFNMEQANFTTQTLKDNVLMVDSMKTTVKEMKSTMKHMNIDKVEDIRDELDDLMQDSSEIQDIMSRSFEIPGGIDEGDLEAELDALNDEAILEQTDLSYLETTSQPVKTSSRNQPLYE